MATPIINAPTAGNPLVSEIAALLSGPLSFGQPSAAPSTTETFIPLALGNIASALTGNQRFGAEASRSHAEDEAARRAEATQSRQLQAAELLSRREGLLKTKSDMLQMQYEAAVATGNLQAASDTVDKQIKAGNDLAKLREQGENARQANYLDAWRDVTGMQANAASGRNKTGDPYLDQLLAQTEERRKILSDLSDKMIGLKYKPNQFSKFIKEHPEEAKSLQLFDQAALGKPLEGESYEQFFSRAVLLTGDVGRAKAMTLKLFPKAVFTDSRESGGANAVPAPTGFQRDLNAAMNPFRHLLGGLFGNPYFSQPDTTERPTGGGGKW